MWTGTAKSGRKVAVKRAYFTTKKEWRAWLRRHYDTERGVWLIFYKKETGKPTLAYESAVEEALCYGWIDSTVKTIDDETYARKFTPRKEKSNWSDLNKKRATKLIMKKRMTRIGMRLIEAAKESGLWDRPDRPAPAVEMPREFQNTLRKNRIAFQQFNALAPSHQKQYIMWVGTAKRPETRAKRIAESIELLGRGKKLGLK